MSKRTPFYNMHLESGAKMVDFAGWDMPLHYGSQLKEHHQVRNDVGMFDVSHMGVVDVSGVQAADYLRFLLANSIDKLAPGKALYTCMLNEQGGIIDDLIVYELDAQNFRIVINAGRREKDLAWMRKHIASFEASIKERLDLVMLAIQGPQTKHIMQQFLPSALAASYLALKPFTFLNAEGWFIARTGYTGEDGVEMIFSAERAEEVWHKLVALACLPCGLGARDTLRLEAGLNLYGTDMDEQVIPHESNLAWTVQLQPAERNFMGREALIAKLPAQQKLVGLVLEGPGIIRNHQKVTLENGEQGEVTSGGYAPTLDKSIALARVPASVGEKCFIEIRQRSVPARVVKPPFVRNGQKCFDDGA